VISTGSQWVAAGDICADLSAAGLTENDVQESVQILNTYGYVKGLASQAGILLFEVQFRGMEEFSRAAIPNYASIVRSVALQILNHKAANSLVIGHAIAQPRVLVTHILKLFQNQGLLKIAQAQGDDMIFDVSPLLRRSFS
jgi:hypothetical protein